MKVAEALDDFGVHYIEGGWPGSNPKDIAFFKKTSSRRGLKHAKIAAFGSTRRAQNRPHEDENLMAIVDTGAPTARRSSENPGTSTSRDALRVTREQNLEMIEDSVAYLKIAGTWR